MAGQWMKGRAEEACGKCDAKLAPLQIFRAFQVVAHNEGLRTHMVIISHGTEPAAAY
jgi:hypothetical protein